jgi:hypothetical protein
MKIIFSLLLVLIHSTSSYALICGVLTIESYTAHKTDVIDFKQITNRTELVEEVRSVVETFKSKPLLKERASGAHQEDVFNFALGNKASMEKLGIDAQALELAIARSDQGKISDYTELFTDYSLKSEFMFDVLRGQGETKSAGALKRVLAEAGFGDRTILTANSGLTNAQLREVFKNVKVLQGFLHELPGMTDTCLAFEFGIITEKQFKAEILGNLSHNGPQEGFWKLITEVFVPGALSKSELPGAKEFFEGTIFEGVDGKVKYSGPRSAEGVVHTIGDRLSQGTRGGVVKLYHEIVSFTPPVTAVADLLINNQKLTMKQFELLKKNISELKNEGLISDTQATELLRINDIAITRFESNRQAVNRKIGNLAALESAFANKTEITEITLDGRTFKKDSADLSELIGYAERVMLDVEIANGNPMRPF